MRKTHVVALLTLMLFSFEGMVRADALARLKLERLEATHKAVQALQAQRQEVPRPGPYKDFRAIIHLHSGFSHDSRGKIEEIVSAAKATGTRVLMFTEHPADHYDFFKEGHQGMKDGILLIPGAESRGFLIFPTHSLRGLDAGTSQDFSDLVRRRDGLVFLSHLEERMDWDIHNMTGNEIYNTHADFKDEKKLIASMRNPLWFFTGVEGFHKYPQEAFSALQDYPADYLRRWDTLCRTSPHTGIAANDSHQNIGLKIRLVEGNKAQFVDALDKKLFELDVKTLSVLASLAKDKKPGDVIYQLRLDPYENSIRHVGTHLLLKEQTKKAVWDALESGRAYVAFDWLADASGFDFAAQTPSARHEMGSRLQLADGLTIEGRAPLPGKWKLLRDGKIVSECTGSTLHFPITEPGNYRAEVWLDVAGETKIWILSNPLYVRGEK